MLSVSRVPLLRRVSTDCDPAKQSDAHCRFAARALHCESACDSAFHYRCLVDASGNASDALRTFATRTFHVSATSGVCSRVGRSACARDALLHRVGLTRERESETTSRGVRSPVSASETHLRFGSAISSASDCCCFVVKNANESATVALRCFLEISNEISILNAISSDSAIVRWIQRSRRKSSVREICHRISTCYEKFRAFPLSRISESYGIAFASCVRISFHVFRIHYASASVQISVRPTRFSLCCDCESYGIFFVFAFFGHFSRSFVGFLFHSLLRHRVRRPRETSSAISIRLGRCERRFGDRGAVRRSYRHRKTRNVLSDDFFLKQSRGNEQRHEKNMC